MSFKTAYVLAAHHVDESNFRNNVSTHPQHDYTSPSSSSSSLSVDIINQREDHLLDVDLEEDYIPMSPKHYHYQESRTCLLCLIVVMIFVITVPFLVTRIQGRTLVPLDFYLDSFLVPKFSITGDGIVAVWDVNLNVHNPNNSSVRVHDMRATLSYKDEAVISVSLPQRTSMRANETKTMVVKFETGSWYRRKEIPFSFVAQPAVDDHVLGKIVKDVRHGDMSFVVKMDVTTGYVLPYLRSTGDTVTHYEWRDLELQFTDLGNEIQTSMPDLTMENIWSH